MSYFSKFSICSFLSDAFPLITFTCKFGANFWASFSQFSFKELGDIIITSYDLQKRHRSIQTKSIHIQIRNNRRSTIPKKQQHTKRKSSKTNKSTNKICTNRNPNRKLTSRTMVNI